MEFLDVLETIRAEEASVHRLFGNEGQSASNIRARGAKNPRYQQKLMEALSLIEGVYSGAKPVYLLKEAMTTSDFPELYTDILDRQLLAAYQETPAAWARYAARKIVPDFRAVKRFSIDGAEGVLTEVPQNTDYPESALTETKYTYQVKKYGRLLPFSWELMINDDLDAFRSVPERFGRAARRSEDKFATQLHVDANGPHASFYTTGNGNKVTSNPVLSISALNTAKGILSSMTDSDGEPIMFDSYVLEVPPKLEITALSIVNAQQLELNENGGSTNSRIVTTNWTQSRITVVVNPYIPIVASSSNTHTTWFLHADPRRGRPAMEMGFLRGHESPEIFQQIANARRVGGGGDVMEAFENDAVNYKIRHVFGGGRQDPKCSVGSNGSGS